MMWVGDLKESVGCSRMCRSVLRANRMNSVDSV